MINKKAQNLSITTIILIILGVVILVVLIFGFVSGWERVKSWVAPSDNIEQIVSQCAVACASNQEYGYCYDKKRVVLDKESEMSSLSCYGLYNFFEESLGIIGCNGIDCKGEGVCENSFGGVWFNSPCTFSWLTPEEKVVNDMYQLESKDFGIVSGKYCCVVVDRSFINK